MRRVIRVILIGVTAIFLLPIFVSITGSLMSIKEVQELYGVKAPVIRLFPQEISFEQYKELLLWGQKYLEYYWNSLGLASIICIGNIFVSIIVGFALAKIKSKWVFLLNSVYLLVMMMPQQVTTTPIYMLCKFLNLYDTWWALILPGWFSPFGVFLMRQFYIAMPDEILEAGVLETNSIGTIIEKIVVPNIKGGIITLAIFTFAENWNMVEQPLVLLADPNLYPLSLKLNDIVNGDISVAFAGSILYALPTILLFWSVKNEVIDGLANVSLKR